MNSSNEDQFWKRHEYRERDSGQARDHIDRRTSDQIHEDYYRLEQRVDKLTLICRSLWELLARESDLRGSDLEAKVSEIDLRDGELDHKLRQPVLDCPNCGRKLNAHNRHCIYCGFQDFPHDAFDSV
jgi:hypothetical protein